MKNINEMQVVAAAQGYFVLDCYEDDDSDEIHVFRTAVVAWRIDLSNPKYVMPIPVMLDPLARELAVLRPDGGVEDGETEYPSVTDWLDDRKGKIAMFRASKATQLAKKERLVAGGAR